MVHRARVRAQDSRHDLTFPLIRTVSARMLSARAKRRTRPVTNAALPAVTPTVTPGHYNAAQEFNLERPCTSSR
ncbi:hypothetical protein PSAC2689_60062 [Paraburkholderia sacchari]